jgi:hypothetical protein
VGPAGHSARLRGGVGSTFSWKQCICPTLLTTSERLPYADHMRYVWSRGIRGWRVECVWYVDQVFPAECTSIQITVTPEYE